MNSVLRKLFNQWRPMESAPKVKGVRFLVLSGGEAYITSYDPENVEGDACYGVVDSCCGSYEDIKPEMWKEIRL